VKSLLLILAVSGCSLFESRAVPYQYTTRCHAVPVAERTLAVAAHCVTYGRQVALVPGADLQLVRANLTAPIAELALKPAEPGSTATFLGRELVVVDPLRVSDDGHFFVLATPEIDEGECSAPLVQDGKVLGIAIANDGGHSVFVAAGEIARALKTHPQP
jgi:hypothetical protein